MRGFRIPILLTALFCLVAVVTTDERTDEGTDEGNEDDLLPDEEFEEGEEQFGEEDDEEDGEDGEEEEDGEDGWTENDINLCNEENSRSPYPCWLIWVNPLTPVRTELLHRNPHVYFFHKLFLEDVATALVNTVNATHDFQDMHPYDSDTGEEETGSKKRVMQAAYVPESDEPIIAQIFAVARALVGLASISFDNSLEVFRYRPGGHFARHFDSHGGEALEAPWGDKWLSTLLLYWRVPEGCNCGTAFPHMGVNANPSAGDGIYFFDILTSGRVDPLMEHGGCPVTMGEKWSSFIGFDADDAEVNGQLGCR